jgi:chemotaxis signal transduction protein
MEYDAPETQLPLSSSREPGATTPDAEVLECGIGGCRFGVFVSDVIETDIWTPDYLTRLPSSSQAVLGTVCFNGYTIPVVAVRKLFRLEGDLPKADLLQSMVVSHQGRLLVLLLDGFLSIEPVSKAAFQPFSSLYVSGARWLSGVFILEDRVVPMLDLKSLCEMITSTTSAYG